MAHNFDISTTLPEDIETLLGHQIERSRLASNVTQAQLAAEAGVSRRTITRLENGEGVSLDTFIRVLTALGLVQRIADLLPDPSVSPIQRVRGKGRTRKRARPKANPAPSPWSWEDPDEA